MTNIIEINRCLSELPKTKSEKMEWKRRLGYMADRIEIKDCIPTPETLVMWHTYNYITSGKIPPDSRKKDVENLLEERAREFQKGQEKLQKHFSGVLLLAASQPWELTFRAMDLDRYRKEVLQKKDE